MMQEKEIDISRMQYEKRHGKNTIYKAALSVLALGLIAGMLCGFGKKEKKEELIVFAAASMTETLTELGDAFMDAHENLELVFNFDSSGTLKTQIEEGADADIFISAGQKQMNQIDGKASEEANPEGLDFVLEGTRFDLLENKVVLVVPEDAEGNRHAEQTKAEENVAAGQTEENVAAGQAEESVAAGGMVTSYKDMVTRLKEGSILLAMGNADVPVGQYTQKILEYYGLSEEELASAGCITYGSNVKEVTTQVTEAVVDCGIIYQTDAFSAGLTVVDTATSEMCGQVIYPAAVLRSTQVPELAKEFLEFLTSDEADAVFINVGFTPCA